MTSVTQACDSQPGTSPYLSPIHVADVIAGGGYVLRNDRFGALIRTPGGYVEQYERLPDGRLERTARAPDGSITSRCDDLIPDAAAEAEAAWRIGPAHRAEARRLLEGFVASIMESPAGELRARLEDAVYSLGDLAGEELLDAVEVEAVLVAAAVAAGLEPADATAVVRPEPAGGGTGAAEVEFVPLSALVPEAPPCPR